MAESFTNSLGRAVGVVTSVTSGSIGIQTNKITRPFTHPLALNIYKLMHEKFDPIVLITHRLDT